MARRSPGLHQPLTAILVTCVLALVTPLAGCDAPAEDAPEADVEETAEPAAGTVETAAPGVVEITTTGMNFELPARIPAGWTTFRYTNRSGVTHFAALERMPEGRTVEDSRADAVPVFQDAMNLIVAGDAEAGFAALDSLPPWFFEVVFVGGPGLTAPGTTSQTTVYLEPGTYVVECYVKAPDGTFHSVLGMIEGLVVTDEAGGGTEPTPDIMLTLGDDGITLEGEPAAGSQTFGVRFREQGAHAHFLGHDIHLLRVAEGTDLEAVADWMNWATPQGLTTPAPAEFLGGTQELPAGETAYFTADLTPGVYALVAEVPDPDTKNMLVTFTVE